MVRCDLLSLALALGAFSLAGCQGGRTVTLTVEQASSAQYAAAPVASAHVRAIALATNDVPLPVSLENLEKLDRKLVSGVTDSQGRARLSLRPEGVYLIEVNGPPFGPLAEQGPWRWKLEADGRTLSPLGPEPRDVLVSTDARGR